MDYQQPHGYMRPPPPPPPPAPPSAADPFQRPPPPVPPQPSNHPWPYSAPQFHYQHQTQHCPSPPPPQWPPPHSSDHAQYPQHPPPPPPYPAHQPPPYPAHPHYPPPHPLPPRPPHVQSYSQDWGNGSWSHHQSWQYPTNNNEEDWAAKARAWAAAKSSTDSQLTPSQFVPGGRPEEHNHFHDQYSKPIDPQFLDVHAPLAPTSNYHHYPVAMAPSNRTGVGQLQDSQYMSSGQSPYAADGHVPFAARDGSVAADAPPYQQEKSPISPLVNQQEVPSSYSSMAGNVEGGDRYEKFNSSSSVPVPSLPQHHIQQSRSGWMEEPHHFRGSQLAAPVTDLSDQPLSFAPHFNRDLDAHVQPNYTHTSGGPARGGDPSVGMSYAWAPSSAQGASYPPVPPTMPSGPQVDHSIPMTSPASGHSAPMFPPGPGFQATVPMIGAAFGVGAGVTPHPTTFPGDAYGVAERPKKASVPNWLREEIIKNKAVITISTPDLLKEDSQSIEDDTNDKFSRKGDQADSKSIESSRSTEDEDEDEDEVEAARTAAINKEIKRVLTEVLLKVTDELFDEIATKVLKEEDLSVEVGRDTDLSNPQTLPSAPSILTAKASAKVLIPTKTKENDYEDASDKSTSGSRGDVLGLASYASDEEDEDMQSSGKPNSKESSKHPESSFNKILEGNPTIENGGYMDETEEQRNVSAKLESNGSGRKSPANATSGHSVATVGSFDNNVTAKEIASTDDQHSSKRLSGSADSELQHGSNTSKLRLLEKVAEKSERPDGNLDSKRWIKDDSQVQNTGDRSDKIDGLENKKRSVKKDHKESESSRERLDKKGDEEHRRREDRHARMERSEHYDNSKDKGKERGRTDDNVKNSESRKRLSPADDKEVTTDAQKDRGTSSKKDNDEKRKDRAGDDKKERSRHKSGGESSRHKRRRSSSVGARDREGKDHSVPTRANNSSDESSDDSRRKSHHSRRHRSPSPIRRRKRQVSRSPHSKHSKRRHSPYSSLEATRGRRSPSRSRSRSRSRSPVHRRR